MTFEKVGLDFQAANASKFIKDNKDVELSLRRQSRALQDNARDLQKEVIAMKAAGNANKALIADKQRLIQQYRLQSQAIKAKIAAMREEDAAVRRLSSSTKVLQGNATALTGTFKSLAGTFSLLTTALSAGAILKAAEDFTQLRSKVKDAIDNVAELDSVMQKLFASSNRSGVAIDAVAQAFVRLRPAAQELGVTNEQLIRFNETFAKMGALAGATSEEIKNTMIQLSQGLASGTLRGDELRSVMEQMPQVARTIAESMGIPFKAFKKAAEDGKISAEAVFKAIMDKADEVDQRFAQLPPSINRSMNRILNAITPVIGKMNDAVGVVREFAKALDDMAKTITEASKHSNAFDSVMNDLGGTVNSLVGAFKEMLKLAGELGPFFAAVASGARVAAFGIEALALNLREVAIRHRYRMQSFGPNNDKQLEEQMNAEVNAMYAESAERNRKMLEDLGLMEKRFTGPLVLSPKGSRSRKGGGGGAETKKKKGKSLESIEKDRLQDIMRPFDDRVRMSKSGLSFSIAKMGAFPNEEEVLSKKLQGEREIAGILNQELLRLNNTSFKTVEAQKALKEAIQKVKLELLDNSTATQEAQNALEKYQKETNFQDFKRVQELKLASIDQIRDREVAATEEVSENLRVEYEKRKLNIDQYYDALQKELEEQMRAEERATDARIELMRKEQEEAKKLNDDSRVKDLEKEILLLQKKLEDARDQNKRKQEEVETSRKTDLEDYSRRFGESLGSAIQEAIEEGFNGSSPVKILKSFVKRLKDAIAGSLAEALVEGFKRSQLFQSITNFFGNLFNKISGRTGNGVTASGAGLNLASLTKGKALGAAAGLAIAGYGVNQAAKAQSLGGRLLGIGAGAGGGALAGAMLGTTIFPGIGTLAGALAGAGLGGGLATARSARGNRLVAAGGGALGGAALGFIAGSILPGIGNLAGAAIGAILGGGAGALMGGGSKRAAWAANSEKNTSFSNSIISGADSSNIYDMEARIRQLANEWRKQEKKGKGGKAPLREGIAQLQQMIAQREKAIADFLDDITIQNQLLADQIQLMDAEPFKRAVLQRQMALKQIEFETKELLDRFKDSEEAKTKILEQESLKRQQLLQEEQEAFKEKTQELRDLLIERDDVSNMNVFTRLRSQEQQKSDRLSDLDRQIAERFLELKGALDAGITAKDTLGLNQVLDQVRTISNVQANLQVLINEANDPNMVREEITRAFETFLQKVHKADVA